jgi:uncharacterized membrane protein SpoIIM required for sporulation
MRQQLFEQRRQGDWAEYSALLARLEKRQRKQAELGDFPQRYRQLCGDIALAQTRGYSLALIEELERLRLEGHALLYRPRTSLWQNMLRFVTHDFPVQVRREWRLVGLASLLFFGPLLALALIIGEQPDFVYRVLSSEQVAQMEEMYADGSSREDAEADVFMFAYYIMNNVGVALRTFAGGLLFGIGAAFVLFYNGFYIGAVAGHLSFQGYHESFLSFVIGHGSLELTAIALAGAAGMRMGLAPLFPGQKARILALREGARQGVHMLYGVMLMLFLAAGLEAFWSASTLPVMVKYVVGTLLWLAVLAYFALAGRARRV